MQVVCLSKIRLQNRVNDGQVDVYQKDIKVIIEYILLALLTYVMSSFLLLLKIWEKFASPLHDFGETLAHKREVFIEKIRESMFTKRRGWQWF